MKPFYSNKGKYADGRRKVVIVARNGLGGHSYEEAIL